MIAFPYNRSLCVWMIEMLKNIFFVFAWIIFAIADAHAVDTVRLIFVPRTIASAAPYDETSLPRSACVFTTEEKGEIARLKALLATAVPHTPSIPLRPNYRQAIQLIGISGEETYFFRVPSDTDRSVIAVRHSLGEPGYASFERNVLWRLFLDARRSAYVPDLKTSKRPECQSFVDDFDLNLFKE
jgi:hypothetical protein